MTAGAGTSVIQGGQGNDRLTSFSGDHHLIGGKGRDVLIFGQGDDHMTGGRGADKFEFQPDSGGANIIADFEVGTDNLEIFASVRRKDVDILKRGDDVLIRFDDTTIRLLDTDKSDIILDDILI